MGRIVKGYWSCSYCGTCDIDGLTDICPNCGKQKSRDVKYYMKGAVTEVTDEELEKAGITKEECDGNHKDWICDYCGQLNNYSAESCVACGGLRSEATREYGEAQIHKEESPLQPDYPGEENVSISDRQDLALQDGIKDGQPSSENHILRLLKKYKLPAVMMLFVFLFIFLFAPVTKTVTVTDFSWERQITLEQERTVKEDDWSVPDGGRVYDEKWEFKEYETVLDHYETVNETKTRQVLDHYETSYSYIDNGNGTFSEVANQTPVYRTATYTESHQEPVYRQEPIYATKYYYEIERWFDEAVYSSAGQDKKPYWDESYVLKENERDTKRSETYIVYYDDGSKESADYEEWINTEYGDGFVFKQNRLGMTYSKSAE